MGPKWAALAVAVLCLAVGCGQDVALQSSSPSATVSPSVSGTPVEQQEESAGLLVSNSLYEAGVIPAVSCRLPTALLTTKSAVGRFAQVITGCLSAAWRPVLGRVSGETFVPPGVFAVDDGHPTPCGPVEDDDYAFYCGANLGIYFDWEMFAAVDEGDRLDTEIDLMDMVAHEYGHHMQLLSGIDERYELRYDDTTGEARLRLTRRMELQANCFAAAFLGANRRPLKLTADRLEYLMLAIEAGDDPEVGPADHGSEESNRYWGRAAFKSGSPQSCNTWSAPVDRVK